MGAAHPAIQLLRPNDVKLGTLRYVHGLMRVRDTSPGDNSHNVTPLPARRQLYTEGRHGVSIWDDRGAGSHKAPVVVYWELVSYPIRRSYSVTLKYVLPCHCGLEVVVEPRQAGETVVCSCGSSLQVPTMLEMTSLDPAPQDSVSPQAPATGWGMSHQLVLLGTTLTLAAVAVGVTLFVQRPISRFSAIDPDEIGRSAQNMSPAYAWEVWETMQQGLDRRTDREYEFALLHFRIWEGIVGGVTLIGIALIAAGVTAARRQGAGVREHAARSRMLRSATRNEGLEEKMEET